jgi:outer membrane protein assembly factor BamA
VEIPLLGLALVCSAMFLPGKPAGEPAARAPQRKRGTIYIVGNDVTRQDVILKQLPPGLASGKPLRSADLRAAERNLIKLDIFEKNKDTGVQPMVEILKRAADEEYADLLIRVQDKPTWRIRRMTGVSSNGELVASLVFEERNFDPFRFPISRDDLIEGRAFRGGGFTLRLELVRIPLIPIGPPSLFRLGNFLLPIDPLRTP